MKVIKRPCPKCGHALVEGWWSNPKGITCPMNMPFQGCGYTEKGK